VDLDIASVIKPSSDPVGATLIKAGAGVMRLSAANTLARTVRVDAGTLALNNVNALTYSSEESAILRFTPSAGAET
jgi:autotransporter-associated beta strand protein